MTCTIGFLEAKKVYMGCDSAAVSGYQIQKRADKKVFKNGEFIFGTAGSSRMKDILGYKFEPPKQYSDQDINKFMVVDFINSIRECFKTGGYARKQDGEEDMRNGTFLVGYKGKLFTIYSDYQVCETLTEYAAIGCGGELALGSLYTSTGKPEDRIMTALQAAQEFSAGVREPFYIESL